MAVKSGYKQTEIGLIPEKWDVITVGMLASFSSGQGIGVTTLRTYSPDYPIPVYGGNGIAGYTRLPSIDAPTVVVGRVGQKCGEVHITEGPTWVTDNALYPQKIIRDLDVRFFGLALSNAGLNDVKNRNDLPLVTQAILHSVRLAWPRSVQEQRIIAGTLSDVDTLIVRLGQLIATKRDLKQATMQQLLTGKRRIKGFQGEWQLKQLGDVAVPRKERIDPRRGGFQEFCVELEHIEPATGKLLGSTSTGENSSLKSVFRPGDVLFGKLRAYLRKYWLADCSGVCSTEIWALVPNVQLIAPFYLFQLVKVDQFIETASSAYGTHMPRSDWNVVKNYEIRLPSLPEQTAIAEVLSDMDAEIEALKKQRDKTRALKQGMMRELLTGRIRLV